MKNFMSFDEFKAFKMNEDEDDNVMTPKEYGCLMAYYDIPNWNELLSQIAPEDLYESEEERYGLENEPHVTILYGFDLESTTPDAIREAIEELEVEPITDLEIVEVGKFENEEYDVLKLTVESATLRQLNTYFRENFKYENDYPDYKPHMTIAYLQPGAADKYMDLDYSVLFEADEEEADEGGLGSKSIDSDHLVYSGDPEAEEGEKTHIPLVAKETIEKIEDTIEDTIEDSIEDLDAEEEGE